ncbi:MAG: hypothetical protein ACI8TQ_000049 [Planctomycetota bacterium]|jgi:hypothetical protein
MARQQKSLLEAFQRANDERAGGDPASAGPFAATPTTDLHTAEPRNLMPKISARDSRVILGFVGWSLVVFVTGLLAGRYFVPSTSFASETAPLEQSLADGGQTGWTGSSLSAGEEMDAALWDTDNTHTVLVFNGDYSEDGNQEVWDRYYSLSDQGLPVATPIEFDGRVYLMVGAARSEDDLKALEQYLIVMAGDAEEPFPFREAFTMLIDKILTR